MTAPTHTGAMMLPFTTDAFFAVVARYHAAVWPAPVVLNLIALVIVVLVLRGGAASGRWVAALLALLWVWMALVYHFAFFAAINPAAWGFGSVFLLGAGWMAWVGVLRSRLRFNGVHGSRGAIGAALIVFALLVYPALGARVGSLAVFSFGVAQDLGLLVAGVIAAVALVRPSSAGAH